MSPNKLFLSQVALVMMSPHSNRKATKKSATCGHSYTRILICFILFFIFCILSKDLTIELWLAWNLWCSPNWPEFVVFSRLSLYSAVITSIHLHTWPGSLLYGMSRKSRPLQTESKLLASRAGGEGEGIAAECIWAFYLDAKIVWT